MKPPIRKYHDNVKCKYKGCGVPLCCYPRADGHRQHLLEVHHMCRFDGCYDCFESIKECIEHEKHSEKHWFTRLRDQFTTIQSIQRFGVNASEGFLIKTFDGWYYISRSNLLFSVERGNGSRKWIVTALVDQKLLLNRLPTPQIQAVPIFELPTNNSRCTQLMFLTWSVCDSIMIEH